MHVESHRTTYRFCLGYVSFELQLLGDLFVFFTITFKFPNLLEMMKQNSDMPYAYTTVYIYNIKFTDYLV